MNASGETIRPLGDGRAAPPTAALLMAAAAALLVASGASAQDGTADVPLVLAPITVEGDPGVVTEGTGSYATDRATVGYKQPVAIQQVPQSITVITRQRLDDENATTLEEAAYLIPNVTTATGNLFDGSLYSRGHEVFTYNVDGAPRPFLSLYGTAPDLVFFDRVEVLSGPSGVFQGSGEPVGTINLVRKRPTGMNQARLSGIGDSFGSYRGEGDASVAFGREGELAGRFVGYGLHRETYLEYANQDKLGGYGTLEVRPTDQLTISVGGLAESEDTLSMSGLPTFTDGRLVDHFPTDTFLSAPWAKRDIDTAEGFLDAEYAFGSGGVAKLSGRLYDRFTDIKNPLPTTGVDPATGDFDMFTFARTFDELDAYADGNYTHPFDFFGRDSTFAIGADYRRTEQDTKQNFDFSIPTQNVFTFDPEALIEPMVTFPGVGPGFRLNTESTAEEIGGYAYLRLQLLDGLHLAAGGRYASYDREVTDTGRSITTEISEDRFVPLAGLSYDILPQLTVYGSYSEIFQPQSELAADGSGIAPIVGRQFEVGAKASLFDGALNAHAAAFQLIDENRAIEDPDTFGAFVPSGEEETRGFEILFSGSPYPGIDLSIGYAFVDTELDSDPTPAHSGVAAARYTFLNGPLEGFYLGASVQAVSGFETLSGGVTIEAPAYAVVNAVAGYEINENLEVSLFVKNLFDNTYIQRINTLERGTFYGEPLNAMLRVTARF